VYTERDRDVVRLVADRVRRTAGQWHHLAGPDRHPVHTAVGQADVEDELALEHVVDLARCVPVHDRRAATRRHPQQDGEEVTAVVFAAGEDDELVGAQGEPFGGVEIHALIDR
jgi:hypothetical protein